MRIFFLTLLAAQTAIAAPPDFSSKTPPCEVPVFHWTTRPLQVSNSNNHILETARNAFEYTKATWKADVGDGDLAGQGAYFEGDPFSSESYGNYLVIAYLKPNSPSQDVRSLGDLDNPANVAQAEAAIRSRSPLLVHRWLSQLGSSDAVVVRGSSAVQLADLPIDLAKTELMVVSGDDKKPWKDHSLVQPSDSLALAFQKFSDRFSDLSAILEAWDATPSDDLIWQTVASDFNEATGEAVGSGSDSHQGFHWAPFDSCSDFDTPEEFPAAIKAFRDAGLISAETPNTVCELKAQLIAGFRHSADYHKFIAIYDYLQNFKRHLGIHRSTASDEYGVSTLDATCKY